MNRLKQFKNHLLVVGLALFVGFGVWSFQQSSSFAHDSGQTYKITVTRTDDGLALRCHEGCAWKKLTHTCQDLEDCEAEVTYNGISGGSSQ